jgi:signal transduction histidine kinase
MLDNPDLDAAERARFLGIILCESERLTRMVAGMLDLAKLQADASQYEFGPVDLAAVLRDAVAVIAPLLAARPATLVPELAEHLPPLRADADKIAQVTVNLLSNAAKFVPAGSGRVRLRLRAVPGGQAIEVEDNGPGIAAADHDRIFARFGQADAGLTEKPAGTGLGLAICRAIVEAHGGTLTVHGAPGEGALFRVVLPA